MKRLPLLLLLFPLVAFGFSSTPDTCNYYAWTDPVSREDGTALSLSEILHTTIYINGEPYRGNGADITRFGRGVNSVTWFGGDCSDCIQATTTDTENRESKLSECML